MKRKESSKSVNEISALEICKGQINVSTITKISVTKTVTKMAVRSKVDETFVIVEISGLFSSLWHYNSCAVTETYVITM